MFSQVVFSATFLGLPAASLVLQSSLELSTGGLALLLGAASVAVVVSEFPWGLAADRFGERRVLLCGTAATTVALAAAAIVLSSPEPSLWVLAGLLFAAAGAGGAVTGPSGSAILGWFSARRHGTLLTFRVAAVPAGGAVGTLAYSWLLMHGGALVAFAVFAAACALCAVLIYVFVFDPTGRTNSIRPAGLPSGSSAPALRTIGVWRVAGSGLLLDVSQFLVLTFAAAILAHQYGYPTTAGLAAVAAMQLIGGGLRVVVGVGTDLISWLTRPAVVRTLAITQASCLSVVALGTVFPLPVALTAIIVAGIASCAWQGAHFTQIAALAGPGQAGSALGLNNAATSLGAFVPQVVAGTLAATITWGHTIILLGVIPALLAAIIFPGRSIPHRPPRAVRVALIEDAVNVRSLPADRHVARVALASVSPPFSDEREVGR